MKKIIGGLLVTGLLAAASFLPIPLPSKYDFSVLYYANKALLHGIALYDYPAQLDLVHRLAGEGFTFHPYPYPPWYALLTLPLALLPIAAAARMWFFLNLAMLALLTALLTPKAKPIRRLWAFLAAVMFLPVFGLLVVGQYSLPVVLGVALFVKAAPRQNSLLLALSLGLMTFKPHIGLPLAIFGFGWLLYRRAWLAVGMTLGLALALALAGLLADPAWLPHYWQSLSLYRAIPGVQTCGLCSSLSVGLLGALANVWEIGKAAWVSLGLALGLGTLFVWRWRARLANPALLMILSTLLVLLADPYLLNYDFALLLLPLFLLAPRKPAWGWAAYLFPWLTLAAGRQGSPLLSVSALLLLAAAWQIVDD